MKSPNMRFGKLMIPVAVMITLVITGCTNSSAPKSKFKLSIDFPKDSSQQSVKQSSLNSFTSGAWGLSDPNSIREMNCFAVAVGGPEENLNKDTCQVEGLTPVTFGVFKGFFEAKKQVEVVVDAGEKRRILLFGAKIAAGKSCVDFLSSPIEMAHHSQPQLIAASTFDLKPGEQSITLSASLEDKKIAGCSIGKFTPIPASTIAPKLHVADVAQSEAGGNLIFTVQAEHVWDKPISFNYTTAGLSATVGSDFTHTTGTTTIPVGATQAQISVPILQDTISEANETFSITLSDGDNYTAASSRLVATGTIEDDETLRTLAIADVTQLENVGAMTFTVTSSGVSSSPITANYTLGGVTAGAGTDYTPTTGVLTIPAGQTSTTIAVPIVDDTTFEADETFEITLSAGSGYMVSGSDLTAVGTILNNDVAPTVSVANVTITEGTGGTPVYATFVVTASSASGLPINLDYTTMPGSATSGGDFLAAMGSATIAVGSLTSTINVQIVPDTIYEPTETFNINLSGGSGYASTGSVLGATGTIVDDDYMTTAWNFTNNSLSAGDFDFDPKFIEFDPMSGVKLKAVNTIYNSKQQFETGALVGLMYGTADRLTIRSSSGNSLASNWTPSFNSLVALWKFENNLNDSSVSANKTLSGSAGYVTGKIGASALSLSGSSVGSPSFMLNPNSGYTVMSWYKPTNTGGAEDLIKMGAAGNRPFAISTDGSARNFNCKLENSGASVVAPGGLLSPRVDQWTHLACVFDPYQRTLTLYLNGIQAGQTSTILHPSGANEPVVISSGTLASFDETAIWSKPLTANQILSIVDQQRTEVGRSLNFAPLPRVSALKHYWRFDGSLAPTEGGASLGGANGAGVTTADSKIGSGSGTLNGSSQYFGIPVGSYNSFTVSLWVKPNSDSAGQGLVSDNGFNEPHLRTASNGAGTTWHLGSTASAARVETGVWTHLAITQSANTQKLFVNGVAVISKAASSTMYTLDIGKAASSQYFNGLVDEVGFYTEPLSAIEISEIYHLQNSTMTGMYISEVIDQGAVANWLELIPRTVRPYGKELASVSESSSDYALGTSVSSGLYGLYHLNDASGASAVDSSGIGRHGSIINNITNEPGEFDKSFYFNGVDSRVSFGSNSIYSLLQHSFSAWVRGPATGIVGCIYSEVNLTGPARFSLCSEGSGSPKLIVNVTSDASGPQVVAVSSANVFDNSWHHVMVTNNNGALFLFIDGKLDKNPTYTRAVTTIENSTLGARVDTAANSFFRGQIDEVAMWSRSLSHAEVLEVYLRGANRIKYQVRSCADIGCECKTISISPAGSAGDCDGDGLLNAVDTSDLNRAGWIGPDGTEETFFSELHNNSGVDSNGRPSGSVNNSGLVIPFAAYPALSGSARPGLNRYFQFRALMSSSDKNALCAGSNTCSPELVELRVGPTNRFYGGSPSLVPNSGEAVTLLQSMGASASGSCARFQVSVDGGANWRFFNGAAWTTATNAVMHSNTSSEIASAFASLIPTPLSSQFKFKAFLTTDPNMSFACVLHSVGISYLP